ncbi:GntR family transcriptional regulator [Altererythrobacter salegens]|uniref:GntR family transcriptional regulator n=1 Tax=Croceibacterium salegens TaxID=1737568 RepID=A0A6I4T201_9SPHN|nr:GntR family transcriptional regulator [Croceibacterium salegens]MXO60662.1 GntR family transcriptional regulator [Croceibacterium salegens]
MAVGSRARGSKQASDQGERLSLADECYLALRKLIVHCDLAPGVRITEKELVARTEFGRTPVREALARLDLEGLVETLPRSGYRVTEVTPKTVRDLYDVFKLVGPLMVRRAAENFTEEHWQRLKKIVQSRNVHNDVDAIMDQSNAAFGLFAEASDNRDLIFLNKRLMSEQHRIFTLYLLTERGKEWSDAQLEFWNDLSWLRDPDTAEARISLGITTSYSGILSEISDQKAVTL